MKPRYEDSFRGITLAPCQNCRLLKNKFYICGQGHTTCDDCKEIRAHTPPRTAPFTEKQASPAVKRVQFALPLTPESPRSSPQRPPDQTIKNRLSPSSPVSTLGFDRRTHRESTSPVEIPSLRSRSPSNEPHSIFSNRSPIESQVTVPTPDRVPARKSQDFLSGETPFDVESQCWKNSSPPRIVTKDCSDNVEIFCRGCGEFVEVIPVTLPEGVIKSSATQFLDSTEGEEYLQESEGSDSGTLVPTTSTESSDGEDLRKDVQELRDGLITTYSELMTARSDLDDVMFATEKLELDVDMLRGGVNYVYFNFDCILKRSEVRQEERICGIPFVLMVRLRDVTRVPHLGFFIGLEPCEGRAHSPLKKTIVFRAHNAYGKVIEKQTLRTFEKGQCVHPCFDLTKPQNCGMFGYSNFIKKDRIMKPDVLKDGRLCLSLQIKPLL